MGRHVDVDLSAVHHRSSEFLQQQINRIGGYPVVVMPLDAHLKAVREGFVLLSKDALVDIFTSAFITAPKYMVRIYAAQSA